MAVLYTGGRNSAFDVYQSLREPRDFFSSPKPAGRQITAGFSYVQRISHAANYNVWFPDDLRTSLAAKQAAGIILQDSDFPANWAAVRQFELLHEAGNYKIYDLDPANLSRGFLDLSKSMRAGGYRLTVATLGTYRDGAAEDDLHILDRRLQKHISQMIHMLYLDEASSGANHATYNALAKNTWDFTAALPHIGMVLGAQDLFKALHDTPNDTEDFLPKRSLKKKSSGGDSRAAARRHARRFFDILRQLPQSHIVHDTAIGLQLPELNGVNEWNYVASPEETLSAFNLALGSLFDCFNGMSLSRLNGHNNPGNEIKSSVLHMRGYGHPLNQDNLAFYQNAAHTVYPQPL